MCKIIIAWRSKYCYNLLRKPPFEEGIQLDKELGLWCSESLQGISTVLYKNRKTMSIVPIVTDKKMCLGEKCNGGKRLK